MNFARLEVRVVTGRLTLLLQGIIWTAFLTFGGSLCSPICFGQPTLSTIQNTGSLTNRVNIVLLSEGYRTNQLGQFLVDATNLLNNLLSAAPYHEYRSYFNAFAISVASVDAGSDHPTQGVFKNTYFNSSYDSYGLPALITVPPNDRDANPNNGQGKVFNLLNNFMPQYDLALLVINDLEYGGSGGSVLLSSLHVNARQIVVHESGHAFGNLADEYADPLPGSVPLEKPNATAQTNRALLKWSSWILPSTPLPTPLDPTNAALVGLFEGAQYQAKGWYRPKLDCKMRTLGTPFCEVCSEALVKSIYSHISPIDAFSPKSSVVSLFSTQSVTFGITPLQPLSHSLRIEWQTNGVSLPDATNTSLQLSPPMLGNGTHILRAIVSDPTALVRSDPGNLLRATNTWSVAINIHQLFLTNAFLLPNGMLHFTVGGTAPRGFVIQASTNLSTWISLATNTLTAGRFEYTNSDKTTPRFYRTSSPP